VTLLHDDHRLAARRAAAAGGLRALAASLADDLEPLLGRDFVVPPEKARLSRVGGRCPRDGVLLEFDPWSPRRHRCPACGALYDDEAHYRWWVMGYQLWLAERAVHAALIHALCGDDRHARFADDILDRYTEAYLRYPNSDNVLGPGRPFFSTYLESIWLLQLAVALSVRESRGIAAPLTARVRDRVIAPSAELIASYDEGDSNRQVWNNAALFAAARLLDRPPIAERALFGPSGLTAHLDRALLADGSWYEGENYHLFAHRGLWYGVAMAATAGMELPAPLLARFDEGFATPFLSALPDLTFPSRRDSQYRVSLRQWRFAELAELGLARGDDPRLVGALHDLYDGAVPRGDTGRARSTAEAERNLPGSALTRADLGWRSLLYARETLPALDAVPSRSVLLPEQGLAVFRRDAGRVYVALDYGHSGGGHGHPDRLNVLLVDGEVRWLDDMGTGSYVDPTLHWYRSTLAHNAPLVDGRSQERVHGVLRAHDERAAGGWIEAEVEGIATGARFVRTLVVMPDYLVDELRWSAPPGSAIDLPVHADGELHQVGRWTEAVPAGGTAPEDGFSFLLDTAVATATAGAMVRLDAVPSDPAGPRATAWFVASEPAEWWRARAPGAPGSGERRFHFLRVRAAEGSILSVWSWRGAVVAVEPRDGRLAIALAGGARHEHERRERGWRVSVDEGGARRLVNLGGLRPDGEAGKSPIEGGAGAGAPPGPSPRNRGAPPHRHDTADPAADQDQSVASLIRNAREPVVLSLGPSHYRRSELPWSAAGRPAADVALRVEGRTLMVDVAVRKEGELVFAPARGENPLDNEHPDTNSDGVQLYVAWPIAGRVDEWRRGAWLLVPDAECPPSVRTTPLAADAGGAVRAEWRPQPGGYLLRCAVPLDDAPGGPHPLRLDVVVNEIAPDRERRRGQLVLSGGRGEFVYLRGDRQAADRHLLFTVVDG
jgi:hypothetical protein